MTQETSTLALTRIETIVNEKGLHARAAAKLAETAGGFEAAISVSKDGQTVAAKSIMGLMMLAASPGSQIELSATGADAEKALDALAILIQNRFDEDK